MRIAIGLVLLLGSCESSPRTSAETWPLPDVLERSDLTGRQIDHRHAALEARARLLEDPRDEESAIWFGRRVAYLGDTRAAIAIYSHAMRFHPDSPRLLRHRGHRYLSIGDHFSAREDLARAAGLIIGKQDVVEADGLPNARNIPTSTLHTNIHYHLGLAQYCLAEFTASRASYSKCLAASTNVDMESAARYWIALIDARLGDSSRLAATLAPVRADWDIIENTTYHDLLLLFRGDVVREKLTLRGRDAVQSNTLDYGLARYALYRGEREQGDALLRDLAGRDSTAFGCLAARADVARLADDRD